MWQASPSTRPPPTAGSLSQCSGASGARDAVDQLQRRLPALARARARALRERRERAVEPDRQPVVLATGLPHRVDLARGSGRAASRRTPPCPLEAPPPRSRRGCRGGCRSGPGRRPRASIAARQSVVVSAPPARRAASPAELPRAIRHDHGRARGVGLDVGQVHAGNEAAGADQGDPASTRPSHRAADAAPPRTRGLPRGRRAAPLPRRLVGEDGRERRLGPSTAAYASAARSTGSSSSISGSTSSLPAGEQPQELLHVAVLGPADVRERVVDRRPPRSSGRSDPAHRRSRSGRRPRADTAGPARARARRRRRGRRAPCAGASRRRSLTISLPARPALTTTASAPIPPVHAATAARVPPRRDGPLRAQG